jgi:hypothetical protein
MWARVKGATEDALFALPLRAYAFRPGFIQPLHGVTSKTPLYARIYRAIQPITPLLLRLLPGFTTTTETLGRAMLAVARQHPARRVYPTRDINALTP